SAVNVFAFGGGYLPTKNLNLPGSADFASGFTLGGGVGILVDSVVEFRATVTGAQTQFRTDGAGAGVYLNRYHIGVELKAQTPLTRAFAPYGLIGGGGVLLHEKGTSGRGKMQGFVHLGLGVAYPIKRAGLTLFTQADGFYYSLSQLAPGALAPYSKTQLDLAWNTGVSYRLPLSP
ncbi:MAG: hypothetical protein ACRDFW_00410, partial [bacterium]